jgi:hypothetical protein
MGFSFKKTGKSMSNAGKSVGKSLSNAGKSIGNVFKAKPVNGICITRECRLDRDLKKLKKKYSDLQKRADILNNDNSVLTNRNTTLNNDITNIRGELNREIYDGDAQIAVRELNLDQSIATAASIVTSALSTPIPSPNYNSYKDIVSENKLLTNKIDNLRDLYQTGDQKSFYEGKQNAYLLKLNSAFFWFYYILILLFAYVLFYIDNSMSNYLKIAIMVLAISYPFIIMPIENFLYKIYKILMAFINVNPYTNDY